MQLSCKDDNHFWTVETRSRSLHPALDLVPGRLCLCGKKVIIDHPGPPLDEHTFRVEPIGGPAARLFASEHPNLVTWK